MEDTPDAASTLEPPPASELVQEEANDVFTQEEGAGLPEEQERPTIATVLEEEENDEKEEEVNVEVKEEHREAEPLSQEKLHEQLLEQCEALILERENMLLLKGQLQHKLYFYFKRKKGEEKVRRAPLVDMHKSKSDQEHRYERYRHMLHELRMESASEIDLCHRQMASLREECQEMLDKVNEEWLEYQRLKSEVALSVMAGKKGKQTAVQLLLDDIQAKEQQKQDMLIQVRIENIKMKNTINRLEKTLKSKEELGDGLHLIDFEQLKIENQTYNEKIEERNEELLKLRKKITGMVQVLSHLKEKVQFVQAQNHVKKEQLRETEAQVAQKRDVLTKTKNARDSLRVSNVKLQQNSGILCNKTLLRDFEVKIDATEVLGQRLETLKRRYAELTLNCCGIKKKIEASKSTLPP